MRNGPEKKRPPYLPDGYALDETPDPDLVVLRRGDGSGEAYFGERASVEEVERAAWEDRRGRDDGCRGPPPRSSGPARREGGGASGSVKGLAGVLGVLLVLAGLFCYQVLPGLIEDELARRLQVGLGLPTEPDVEVSSSFPPELLAGRIDRVRMDAGSARADVRGANVSVASLLLRGEPSLEAESCSLVAEVPGASTQQYLDCSGYLGLIGG